MGYEEAGRVQELFLEGCRDEAIDACPMSSRTRWACSAPSAGSANGLNGGGKSPVTTLLVMGPDSEPDLRAIRDAVPG